MTHTFGFAAAFTKTSCHKQNPMVVPSDSKSIRRCPVMTRTFGLPPLLPKQVVTNRIQDRVYRTGLLVALSLHFVMIGLGKNQEEN